MSLFSSASSYLGVDVGTSSVKIVELKGGRGGAQLITYGFSEAKDGKNKEGWHNNISLVARMINDICEQAGAGSRSAVAALPTFSVFSSVLSLPKSSEKDMASTVHWEAKKVIPLPLDEMILDWKKIDTTGDAQEPDDKKYTKVLLTGAPKTLIKKYISIFKEAKINLLSLETETFSLIRSLIGNDKSTIMLIEVGAATSDISIVSKGIPVLNRSLDIGGETITEAIGHTLKVDKNKAEQFKYDLGISSMGSDDKAVPRTIMESIGPIVNEIKYAMNLHQNKNKVKTEKIILSGGSALLVNFANYLSGVLDMKVIVGDPWTRVAYPDDIKPVLNEIGPRMSVAVGLAMREIF